MIDANNFPIEKMRLKLTCVKIGEMKESKSGMVGFVYEKNCN